MKKLPLFCAMAAASASFLFASPAQAAFMLVDDFEAYSQGSIDGQGGWQAREINGVVASVVTSPTGGQAMSFPPIDIDQQHTAAKSLGANSIANGTTGTLFYQFRLTDTTGTNLVHGLSDQTFLSEPGQNAFGAFEASLSNGPLASDLSVRDGGAYESSGISLSENHWYNLWLVADNSTDTFTVWLQSDTDATFATQIQITTGGDAINFRNGTSDSLSSLLLINSPGDEQALLFDNYYADISGANRVNPIPEPSSAALATLGILALLRRRR